MEQLLNPEVVARIGILRNEHGDISHGRTPLKIQANDTDLAELIIGLTDSIATYMLRKFHQIKDIIVFYDDNPEFNTYLDELSPLPNNILFSKALFEQDQETYEMELADYHLRLNTEDE